MLSAHPLLSTLNSISSSSTSLEDDDGEAVDVDDELNSGFVGLQSGPTHCPCAQVSLHSCRSPSKGPTYKIKEHKLQHISRKYRP